jgi:hypothetical protein
MALAADAPAGQLAAPAAELTMGMTEDGSDLRLTREAVRAHFHQLQTLLADARGRRYRASAEQAALALALASGATSAFSGDQGYARPGGRGAAPRFALLGTPQGSGKTAVALMAALFALGPGWEEARATFQQWKGRPANLDPLALPHAVGRSTRLARLAIVSTITSNRLQWVACVRNTVALLPEDRRPRLLLTEKALMAHLESDDSLEQAALAVLSPRVLRRYFTAAWQTGILLLCLDELDRQAGDLPRSASWGDKHLPSIHRTLGISCNILRMMESPRWRWGLCPL